LNSWATTVVQNSAKSLLARIAFSKELTLCFDNIVNNMA
jgi:hypothetical protein